MTPEETEAWLDEVIWPPKTPYEVMYYHRDGTPARTRREGMAIMSEDNRQWGVPDSHWVAHTRQGPRWVSTIFLALDHSFGVTPKLPAFPLIFESMLFDDRLEGMAEQDAARYSTERWAMEGHVAMVRRNLGRRAARRFQRHGSDTQMEGRWENPVTRRLPTPRWWVHLTNSWQRWVARGR